MERISCESSSHEQRTETRPEKERVKRQVAKERQRDTSENDRTCTCTVVYEAMQAQSPADSQRPPAASRTGGRSVAHTHIDKNATAEGATRTT